MDYATLTADQAATLDANAWAGLLLNDTTAPGVPTALAALAGNTLVYLTWTNPPDSDFASVTLRRNGTVVYVGTAGAYADVGRTNGTAYGYTVSAADTVGNESPQSATVTATPRAYAWAAPSDVRLGIDRGDGVAGSLTVPSASQVLSGVAVDATVGNVTLPPADRVLSGYAYGASGTQYVGTLALAPSAAVIAAAVRVELATELARLNQLLPVGTGADKATLSLTLDDTLPLADADCWATRDAAGLQVIDRQRSNTAGVVVFLVDGYVPATATKITYYAWAQKTGVVSVQGVPFTCD